MCGVHVTSCGKHWRSRKRRYGASSVHIKSVCAIQVLLDYNLIFLTIWNNVNKL